MIVSTNSDVEDQLAVAGITEVIGTSSIYRGDERVGAAVQQAEDDASRWSGEQQRGE